MDINMPVLNGLEATEYIYEHYPEVSVIIMSVQSETEYLRKAMVSGAKSYIIKPFSPEDLIQSVRDTVSLESKRKENLRVVVEKEEKFAEVISFFSTKGGVGKTVLATNLAVMLSKKKKVLLIDADLLFGDIGILLDIRPLKTIIDLIEDHVYEDFNAYHDYLQETEDGFDVLLAPRKPEEAEFVSAKALAAIIKTTRQHYDTIIIDLGTNYSEATLTALDLSSQIYMISTYDLLSIKNTLVGLDVMKSLSYDVDKLKLVLNKRDKRNRISEADIKKILKYPITAALPLEKKLLDDAVQLGEPVTKVGKVLPTRFEKSLKALAEAI
jgi:pilus assembly protein CpaE